MKAIILAAGEGTRMRPLTLTTPKPLIKIAGKPMIEYLIDLLRLHGVKEIGINLFYKGDNIKAYLGNGVKLRVKIKYLQEDQLTGTAGGVKKVAKLLQVNEPFFVISSDMMVNFNLTDIYNFHKKSRGIATISCYWRPTEKILNKSGVVIFEPGTKKINNFIEKPKTSKEVISNWVNSSVYVFNPKIVNYIPDKINGSTTVDLPKDIFPILMNKNESLFAFSIDKNKYYQMGVDTPDRISTVEEDIKKGVFIPAFID